MAVLRLTLCAYLLIVIVDYFGVVVFLSPIHTADETKLSSLVASASAVCIGLYVCADLYVLSV